MTDIDLRLDVIEYIVAGLEQLVLSKMEELSSRITALEADVAHERQNRQSTTEAVQQSIKDSHLQAIRAARQSLYGWDNLGQAMRENLPWRAKRPGDDPEPEPA